MKSVVKNLQFFKEKVIPWLNDENNQLPDKFNSKGYLDLVKGYNLPLLLAYQAVAVANELEDDELSSIPLQPKEYFEDIKKDMLNMLWAMAPETTKLEVIDNIIANHCS